MDDDVTKYPARAYAMVVSNGTDVPTLDQAGTLVEPKTLMPKRGEYIPRRLRENNVSSKSAQEEEKTTKIVASTVSKPKPVKGDVKAAQMEQFQKNFGDWKLDVQPRSAPVKIAQVPKRTAAFDSVLITCEAATDEVCIIDESENENGAIEGK